MFGDINYCIAWGHMYSTVVHIRHTNSLTAVCMLVLDAIKQQEQKMRFNF